MDKKNIKCWAQFTCTVGIYVNGAIVHLCKCLDLNIVAIYLEESNKQTTNQHGTLKWRGNKAKILLLEFPVLLVCVRKADA